MNNKSVEAEQGFQFLSDMGKKVLRPGGKEFTLQLLENLHIDTNDKVVEFAPGTGYTALKILEKHPKAYTGVELSPEAGKKLRQKIQGGEQKIIIANAAHTGMEDSSASKVLGEAMLTMHANHRKAEIIHEAWRLLKKGGFYGIHELALSSCETNEEFKTHITRELALSAKVNARPLTEAEWISLLEEEGFKVRKIMTCPMLLLEPRRLVDDEGFSGVLKIGVNVLSHRHAGKRILEMRRLFKKHQKQMRAIAIIAEKV